MGDGRWGWSGAGALAALGFALAGGALRRAELAPCGAVVGPAGLPLGLS